MWPYPAEWIRAAALDRIENKLDRCIRMLDAVLTRETKIMTALSDALDQAEAAAASNSAADDAAEALLIAISQMIADLKAAGTDPATVARITSLATALNTRAAQLSAAVVAGTGPPAA